MEDTAEKARPRMTIASWYQRVNEAWPKPLPKPSPEEVKRGAVRLLKFGLGEKWPVRETTGNRYTWVRRGEFVVNVEKNWHGTVHDVSHYVHYRLHPGERPHSKTHARIELRMVKEAVKRGWLDGALVRLPKAAKPEPTPDEKAVARLDRVHELQKAWTTKHKRATTALAKLAKEEARLLKRIG